MEMGVEYGRRPFERTGLAIIADGSDDNLINLERMERESSFMDADSTPERLEDVLPASPAPADEQHPPGSSDEEDDSDKDGGESNSGATDELATLDVDDELDQGGEPLPLEIPSKYVLASSAPATLTAELVKRPIALRLGIGWLKGTITWQAQARTRLVYDYRVFVDGEGSIYSLKLPFSKYSVDGSSGEGSWALLECLAQTGGPDKESQEGTGKVMINKEEDGVNHAEAVGRPKGKIQGQAQACRLGRGGVVVDRTTKGQGFHAKRAPDGPADLCSTIARGEIFLRVAPNRNTIP